MLIQKEMIRMRGSLQLQIRIQKFFAGKNVKESPLMSKLKGVNLNMTLTVVLYTPKRLQEGKLENTDIDV